MTFDAFGDAPDTSTTTDGGSEEPLYLHSLQVTDFRRLDMVDMKFTPGPGVVAISGPNESGKTSTLRAIEAALGLGKVDQAVRKGREAAVVKLGFGDYELRTRWKSNPDGTETCTRKLSRSDGSSVSKPREAIDALVSAVAVDPLAWVEKGKTGKAGRREQARDLIRALGVEPPSAQIAECLDAIADHIHEHSAGYDETDPIAVCGAARQDAAGARRKAEADAEAAEADAQREQAAWDGETEEAPDNADLAHAAERAREGRREWTEWKDADLRAEQRVAALESELAEARRTLAAHREARVPEVTQEAVSEAESRLAQVQELQRQASICGRMRAAQQRAIDAREIAELAGQAVEAIKGVEAGLLSHRHLPVEGLAFDIEGGLTLDGVAFPDGASGEQQIMVGLAVAMHSNPALKLLRVDDGNKLDRFHRGRLAEMVRDNGYQLLLVLVDDRAEELDGIVLADGRVAADHRPREERGA